MARDNIARTKINLEDSAPILVAAAWPYVNGDLHVGHLPGYFLPADIFARYNRLKGRPVLMVSGSDCHGTPIVLAADKEGKTPKEIVDEYHPKILNLIEQLNVQYDLYTTTLTENHYKITQDIFLKLLENGYISKKLTKQYYSEQDQKFLPDRYVEGTCPVCSYEPARADQCDNCGTVFSEGELLNAHSKATGAVVIMKDTEHYFFDLNKLQLDLENYVEDKDFWKEWIIAETKGWLKKGLIGRSITRDLDWGIPIPVDRISKELLIDNAEDKRFYVWFDAVIGYLSASIEWSNLHKKNENSPKWLDWEYYWKNPEAKHYYFMGKDNLFFHTISWPAMLIGSKDNLNLPYMPGINQFLNLEGKKFSKSKGIVLYPEYIIKNYGLDILRFYITTIMPENHDADWSWSSFVATNNNELVANLGNFIYRVLSFYKSHSELKFSDHGKYSIDKAVEDEIVDTYFEVGRLVEECKFSEALARIMKLSSFGNKYLADNAPWLGIKESVKYASETIYNSFCLIDNLKILLYPFIPTSMDSLNRMLGYTDKISTKVGDNQWKLRIWDINQQIENFVEPLFPKFDGKEVLERESKK